VELREGWEHQAVVLSQTLIFQPSSSESANTNLLHPQQQEEETQEEPVELREGREHQAVVPPMLPGRPAGPCRDPRAGLPGPTLEEALASAAGKEKAVAEALPLDAIQVLSIDDEFKYLLRPNRNSLWKAVAEALPPDAVQHSEFVCLSRHPAHSCTCLKAFAVHPEAHIVLQRVVVRFVTAAGWDRDGAGRTQPRDATAGAWQPCEAPPALAGQHRGPGPGSGQPAAARRMCAFLRNTRFVCLKADIRKRHRLLWLFNTVVPGSCRAEPPVD